MPQKVDHRSVTPFVNAFRRFLRGREHTNALRFADCVAARNQPPPDVPGGPYHRTSKIYYYARDARREVEPPLVIPIGGRTLTAGRAGIFPAFCILARTRMTHRQRLRIKVVVPSLDLVGIGAIQCCAAHGSETPVIKPATPNKIYLPE